jgi:hypothetical protein
MCFPAKQNGAKDMVENNFPELNLWMELAHFFLGRLSGCCFLPNPKPCETFPASEQA